MQRDSENHDTPTDANNVLAVRFISENIIVDRFPVSKEIKAEGKHSECQVVINVSDEFYLGNSEEIMKEGKLSYYFPMGESGELMGLNSMFGALQVLHQIYTWNPEWKVLLHCQAGKNRSPTIKSAFHFMMLGEHEPDKTKQGGRNNRLIDNCKRGHLPPLAKMELFLLKCKEAFDHPEKFFGGMFDWVMSESGCSSNMVKKGEVHTPETEKLANDAVYGLNEITGDFVSIASVRNTLGPVRNLISLIEKTGITIPPDMFDIFVNELQSAKKALDLLKTP